MDGRTRRDGQGANDAAEGNVSGRSSRPKWASEWFCRIPNRSWVVVEDGRAADHFARDRRVAKCTGEFDNVSLAHRAPGRRQPDPCDQSRRHHIHVQPDLAKQRDHARDKRGHRVRMSIPGPCGSRTGAHRRRALATVVAGIRWDCAAESEEEVVDAVQRLPSRRLWIECGGVRRHWWTTRTLWRRPSSCRRLTHRPYSSRHIPLLTRRFMNRKMICRGQSMISGRGCRCATRRRTDGVVMASAKDWSANFGPDTSGEARKMRSSRKDHR